MPPEQGGDGEKCARGIILSLIVYFILYRPRLSIRHRNCNRHEVEDTKVYHARLWDHVMDSEENKRLKTEK